MKPKVLVTGAGGAAAICFMKAVSSEAVEPSAADSDVHAAGLFLVPRSNRVRLLPSDDPRFSDRLLDICVDRRIDVVVPTTNADLVALARHRDRFASRGVILLLAREDTLETCFDAIRLLETCESVVPVPRFARFNEAFDASSWTFPLVVKSSMGSAPCEWRIVRSHEDLDRQARSESLVVQEYLPGEEYSVDVLTTRRGWVIGAVPRIRLRVDRGIAVAARTIHDAQLEDYARRVARAVRLTGVGSVRFRRNSDGQPTLLGVKPRVTGMMALTVVSGVNMPSFALRDAIGMPFPDRLIGFKEISVVRHLQEVYMEGNPFPDLRIETPRRRRLSVQWRSPLPGAAVIQ